MKSELRGILVATGILVAPLSVAVMVGSYSKSLWFFIGTLLAGLFFILAVFDIILRGRDKKKEDA